MTSVPTRFEGIRDLARLPWFELRADRLVVADPAVPTAIDVHTHLALTYVVPSRVDLRRASARTRHYLPEERTIDLEGYQNSNFTPGDLRALSWDLTLGSVTSGGMRATHTIPNLLREMAELNIGQSVLLAIDAPFGLSHNARDWLEAARDERGVVVFGSVHPFDRDVEGKLDAQMALGARGIKVHPAVQMVRPDARRCLSLYRACGARRLPVFFHCGPVDIETRLGRYLSQVRHYERAIAECPDTQFVLGHAGALQMEEALGFARKYPNVWLEVASQSLTNVRRLVAEAPPQRLLFGTDWPFYPQSIGLAKVLLATEDHLEARRAILRDNATHLLGETPRATSPVDHFATR